MSFRSSSWTTMFKPIHLHSGEGSAVAFNETKSGRRLFVITGLSALAGITVVAKLFASTQSGPASESGCLDRELLGGRQQ